MKKIQKFITKNGTVAADITTAQIAAYGIITGLEITNDKPYCTFCGFNVKVLQMHKHGCKYDNIMEDLDNTSKGQ